MANKNLKYGNIIESSRADATLTFSKYIKDIGKDKSVADVISEFQSKFKEIDDAVFMGFATPETSPKDESFVGFYIASEKGTYTYFDGLEIQRNGVYVLYCHDGAWNVYDMLSDSSVLTQKIVDKAITTEKLADDAVTNEKIADNAVKSEQIENNSIHTEHIADKAVVTAKIENRAVTSDKIEQDAIQAEHMATDSVITDTIVDKAITTEKLDDEAVTVPKVNGEVWDKLEDEYLRRDGENYMKGNLDMAGNTITGAYQVANGSNSIFLGQEGYVMEVINESTYGGFKDGGDFEVLQGDATANGFKTKDRTNIGLIANDGSVSLALTDTEIDDIANKVFIS